MPSNRNKNWLPTLSRLGELEWHFENIAMDVAELEKDIEALKANVAARDAETERMLTTLGINKRQT